MVKTLVLLLFIFPFVAKAGAVERDAATYVVTRNVTATLADPSQEIAIAGQVSLFSSGTKALVFKNVKNDHQYLALSEFGIWAWIDKTAFWEKFRPQDFGFKSNAVTITRPGVTAQLGAGTINLGVSTTYELVSAGERFFTIRIRGRDWDFLNPKKEWKVLVSKQQSALVETHAMTRESTDYFTQGTVDEIHSLVKSCDEERVVTIKLGARTGLGITWEMILLGLSAEQEQKRSVDSPRMSLFAGHSIREIIVAENM